jgi:hypothetical protein
MQMAIASAMGRNTNPQTAPQPNGKPVSGLVPFVRAALRSRFASTSQSLTLGTAVQTQQHVIPAIGGWNRWIELQVANVTAANAAAVAFAADAPFNVFTQIVLQDAGQKPLFILRGFDSYVAENIGGYHLFAIDNAATGYTVVTGAVATGGSFNFSIYIPQELARDGIGSYPNMDASQRLTIALTVNLNANLYTVAPTTPGTLTVTPIVHYYARPAEVSADGQPQETTPAGAGTVQYWRSQVATVNSGANVTTFNLSGRYLRNCWALFTDGSDVRSNTVKPTSMRVELDNNLVFDIPTTAFDSYSGKFLGIANVTGLIPFHLGALDPDNVQGSEWADSWWKTATSSQLVLKYTAGAAGKLYLLMNEVEPVGSVFR